MSRLVVLVVALAQLALSKTVNYKWDISWVTAAPDGFSRPVIGINGQWPCPQIDVETGDRLVVEVYNGLGNQSTGLHWHGMYQNGTGYMDGTTGVTQCPIPPGHTLTYDFVVSVTLGRRLSDPAKSRIIDRSSRVLLVSFAQSGPIPRRALGASYCPRSKISLRKRGRRRVYYYPDRLVSSTDS